MVQIWDRVVAYIKDPATQADAIDIMARRVGITPKTYKRFLDGTHLLSLSDSHPIFERGPGLDSLYGSDENADRFNVQYNVYKHPQNVDSYIKPLF